MTALPIPLLTASQYLELEEYSRVKHEFVDGIAYAMAGVRPIHNQIAVNIGTAISNALDETAYIVFNSDQQVRNSSGDTYFYPDLSVACAPEFERHDPTSLLNPVLICEVLSPTTQNYDLGAKLERYSRFDSIQAILLVSSDDYRVELRERADFTSPWQISIIENREGTLPIRGLSIDVPITAIYA